MAIAWTFLVPLGAFIAAFGRPRGRRAQRKELEDKPSNSESDPAKEPAGEKDSDGNAQNCMGKWPVWLALHVTLQVLALILTIPGMVIAFDSLDAPHDLAHRNIGIGVIAVGYFQGFNALFKPPRGAKRRRVWSLVHIVCGRLAAIFGVVNTFLGLNRYDEIWRDPATSRPNGVFWIIIIIWHIMLGIAAITLLLLRVGHHRRTRRENRAAARQTELATASSMPKDAVTPEDEHAPGEGVEGGAEA